MICCLNPNCPNPHRFDETNVCPSCGVPLVLLRGRYRFMKLLSDRGDANSTYLAQDAYQGNELCVLKPLGPSFPREAAQQKAKQQFEREVRCLQDLGEYPQFPRAIAYLEEGGWLYLVQEYLPEPTLEQELQKHGCWSESQIRELLLELLPAIELLHDRGCIHGNIKPANIRRRSDRPLPAESLPKQKTAESPQFLPEPSESSPEAFLSLSPETAESPQFLRSPQQPEPSSFLSWPERETSSQFPPDPELGGFVISEWSSLLPLERPDPEKPSAGELVLIDFASCKPWGPSLQYVLSRTGTKGYAPLEQRRDSQTHPNSDLYALGVTCFRLLTQADPKSLLLDRGYNWVARWRKYLPEPISPDLERILDKLLQANRQQRYQKAAEVIADLQQPLERDTAIATPQPQGENPWRRKLLWVLPILGLLGLGIYRIAANSPESRRASEQTGQKGSPERSRRVAETSGISPTELPDNSDSSYNSDGSNQKNYQKIAPAKTLARHGSSVDAIAISPDGKTLVSGGGDGTIEIWNPDDGTRKSRLESHKGRIWSLAISPDSRILASGSEDNTIKIWHLKTGVLKATLKGHEDWVSSLAISPDGRHLISSSGDGTIKIWDLKAGLLKSSLTAHGDWISDLAIAADGRTLVSASFDKTIKVWQLNNAKVSLTSILAGHSEPVRSVAIAANGKTIASGSYDKTIKIWNLGDGKAELTLQGHSEAILSVAISPDGQTLASGSGDRSIKIWQLVTGKLIQTLAGHGDAVVSVAISAAMEGNGKTLASGSLDDTIKIWQLPSN